MQKNKTLENFLDNPSAQKTLIDNLIRSDIAKATWCAYTDSNNIQREVWLEDNKSIEIKFDFAKLNNLGGIAIRT